MKMSLALPLVVAGTLMASEPPVNPIVEDFAKELTFHLDFDDGTVQPAVGRTTLGPDAVKRSRLTSSELGGQALVNGMLAYAQHPESPLIDTTRAGTIICWVRLNGEQNPRTHDLNKWEGGATFFDVSGPSGAQLLLMKNPNCLWGRGALTFYTNFKDAGGKVHTASVEARCSYADWKVGEWRMVAAAWTAAKIYVSVNGAPFVSNPLVQPLLRFSGGVYVTATYWNDKRPEANQEPGTFAVDEVSILNRKLTDEEVKSIYEKMSARLAQRDS